MRPEKKKIYESVGDQLSDPGVCGVTCMGAGHGVFLMFPPKYNLSDKLFIISDLTVCTML